MRDPQGTGCPGRIWIKSHDVGVMIVLGPKLTVKPFQAVRFGSEPSPDFLRAVKSASAVKLVLKLDEQLEAQPESQDGPEVRLMESELVRKLGTMKTAFQKGFQRVLSCRANVRIALNNALAYSPSEAVKTALDWEVPDSAPGSSSDRCSQ